MKPYEIRRRDDGKVEIVPNGSDSALLVFDSTDELVGFLDTLAKQLGRKEPAVATEPNPLTRTAEPIAKLTSLRKPPQAFFPLRRKLKH